MSLCRTLVAPEQRNVIVVDECYVWRDAHSTQSWFAPAEDREPLQTTVSKGPRVSVIGAGSSHGWCDNGIVAIAQDRKGGGGSGMDAQLVEAFFRRNLLPALAGQRCLIVMDNSSTHKRAELSRSAMGVDQKRVCLEEHGVAYPRGATREVLDSLMVANSLPRTVLDRMCSEAGHMLLYIPPYSPRFNAIEHVWGVAKNRMRSANLLAGLNGDALVQAVTEQLRAVDEQVWSNCVASFWHYLARLGRQLGLNDQGEAVAGAATRSLPLVQRLQEADEEKSPRAVREDDEAARLLVVLASDGPPPPAPAPPLPPPRSGRVREPPTRQLSSLQQSLRRQRDFFAHGADNAPAQDFSYAK